MKLSATVLSAALTLAVLLTSMSTAPAAPGPEATAVAASEPSSQPAFDDFGPDAMGPMVLAFVGIFAIVVLVLIGFGAVLGVIAILALAMMVGLGIVSTSVVVGFVHRRARTGFRVFFLLTGAAGGVPSGIALLMVANWLFHLGLSDRRMVGMGGLAGAIAGFTIAALFNFAWGRIVDYLARKIGMR